LRSDDVPRGRAALGQGREGITRRDIQRQLEESTRRFEAERGGGAEAVGVGPTLEETKKGAAELLQMRIQSRDLDRESAEIAKSQLGLTREQREAPALQLIERTRLRDLEAAGTDEAAKDLANFRAEI